MKKIITFFNRFLMFWLAACGNQGGGAVSSLPNPSSTENGRQSSSSEKPQGEGFGGLKGDCKAMAFGTGLGYLSFSQRICNLYTAIKFNN